MSISKFPGHMQSIKLYFSATVLTLGLKAKIFGNLRLNEAKILAGTAHTPHVWPLCGPIDTYGFGRVSHRFRELVSKKSQHCSEGAQGSGEQNEERKFFFGINGEFVMTWNEPKVT